MKEISPTIFSLRGTDFPNIFYYPDTTWTRLQYRPTHTLVTQTGTTVTPNPGGKFGEFMTAIEFAPAATSINTSPYRLKCEGGVRCSSLSVLIPRRIFSERITVQGRVATHAFRCGRSRCFYQLVFVWMRRGYHWVLLRYRGKCCHARGLLGEITRHRFPISVVGVFSIINYVYK